MVAGMSTRCHREGDTRSPEAGRHSAAAHREHIVTGMAATGAVATGAAVIGVGSAGAEAIGTAIGAITIIIIIMTFSSAASAFRSGAGVFHTDITAMVMTTRTDTAMVTATRTDTATAIKGTATAIKGTATAIKGTATAIKDTATAIVTAEDPRARSCSVGWLARDTTTAALMESWDQRRDVRFGRTNAATISASTARSIATRFWWTIGPG